VPAAKLIPVAEETGLIVAIGHWVLKTACEQASDRGTSSSKSPKACYARRHQGHGRAVELRALGIRFSVDGFGTGYSSLYALRRFPVDAIKVDCSFIRDLPDSEDDKAIARAIITMGKQLGMTVVAEGMESAAQRDLLREQGCDRFQGLYLSKAVPPAEVSRLLVTERSTAQTTAACLPVSSNDLTPSNSKATPVIPYR
jgi:EAL domain-containing protein (putative c-di-GMP-specific phosphodiesterase class I)